MMARGLIGRIISLKGAISAVIAIFLAGAGGYAWSSRFARGEDLSRARDDLSMARDRVGQLEYRVNGLERDLDWIKNALYDLALRSGTHPPPPPP